MVACKKRSVHPQSGSRLYHPRSQSKSNIKSGLLFPNSVTPRLPRNIISFASPSAIKCQWWLPCVAWAGSRGRLLAGPMEQMALFHFISSYYDFPSKLLHWTIRRSNAKGEKETGEGKGVIVLITPFSSTPTRKSLRFFSPLLRVDSSTSRVSDSWS